MTEILMNTAAVVLLLAGLVALVRFARKDRFAAPGTGHQPADELGPLGFRRRPA